MTQDSSDPPRPELWIAPASQAQAEQGLFRLLASLPSGRPEVELPLLVEAETMRAILDQPNPDLVAALRNCINEQLLELGCDPATWEDLQIAPAVWTAALAVHNLLTPELAPQPSEDDDSPQDDPLVAHCSALVATLAPARSLADSVARHALLRQPIQGMADLPSNRRRLLDDLLVRSPLSALAALDLHTPPALTSLAAELLPGWRSRVIDPTPWRDLDDWLDEVERILALPCLARYFQHHWLALPETRRACRNLGLLFESLRRRDRRDIPLGFYESYDYLRAEIRDDPQHGPYRHWPLLSTAEELLKTEGDGEVAISLNRWGNEYLLKLLPLVDMVIEEGGMPAAYRFLTPDLVNAVRPLLPIATDRTGPRLDLCELAAPGPENGAQR